LKIQDTRASRPHEAAEFTVEVQLRSLREPSACERRIFVRDDQRARGCPVLGKIEDIECLCAENHIDSSHSVRVEFFSTAESFCTTEVLR